MEDMNSGLPDTIPAAPLSGVCKELIQELLQQGLVSKPEEVTYKEVDKNLEKILQHRADQGDADALFQLAQIQLEMNYCCSAYKNFYMGWKKFDDVRAKYQVAVMLYDNLADAREMEKYEDPKKEACRLFEEIMQMSTDKNHPVGQREMVYNAAYNLARAHLQGCGYKPSVEKAISLLEFAASNGDPKGNILAQTALGYIYSGSTHRDLKKAFFWHNEATGNGSVESQAALGVMYLYGLGVKQNWESALICLSEAADRGSLYGMASLAYWYYKRKMFTNAAVIACKVAFCSSDECIDANCLKNFLARAKAMGCFIYARCLQEGSGVKKDEALANELYSKSIEYDSALAARYSNMVTRGEL